MSTILIIDDRPINRQFLATLLGYGGHRIIEAADGAEALEKARAERPDLVITDIVMPTMDGVAFTRKLRADPAIAETPVIFYTATYRAREAKKLAQTCGVDVVLSKPADPGEIISIVNVLLGARASPPSSSPALPPEVGPHERPSQVVHRLSRSLPDLQELNQRVKAVLDEQDTTAARARLRELCDEMFESSITLQVACLRLATLVEFALDEGLEGDPLRLLDMFCGAAQDIVTAKYAAIGILDESGQKLRLFFIKGMPAEDKARLGMPSPRKGVLGQILSECRSYRIPDLGGNPTAVGLPATHPPIYSFLGAPIATSKQVYGWLYLADRLGAETFSEEDEQIVITLAGQAAMAYENAVLYDELQVHAAQLQQEVAERRRAEEALREKKEELAAMTQQLWQTAKLATVGELSASIAHELNNPLATVSLRVESLLAQREENAPDRRELEIIEGEVERMGKLVANLLQFSRRAGQQISSIDVREEVENTLELIQHLLRNRRIAVIREFPPSLPMIQADRQQFRQLFLNLFTNASDAMTEGGTLTLRVKEGNQPSPRQATPATPLPHAGEGTGVRAASPSPGWVEVVVEDTGMGISPENLAKVTEPFFTTKPEGKGTGLGLAICRRIAQEHGGSLNLDSEVGRGTTVRICLPVSNGANAKGLEVDDRANA